jgi:deazaflavin-dependent oxidoreductase (nitroreductase family)
MTLSRRAVKTRHEIDMHLNGGGDDGASTMRGRMGNRTRLYGLRAVSVRVANPVLRHVAPHLPWFALVRYRGRRSGRAYEIPLNVFRDQGDWVVVLTYGSDAEWVKNILATGTAEMTTRGRRIALTDPRLVSGDALGFLPAPVRAFGRWARVTEVLRLREA